MARREINMPRFGAKMEEAKLLVWRVQVGQRVDEDDVLCEVETEKTNADVESLYSGVVLELVAKENETYPVGFVLGYIDAEDED